ncbi:unnamed protein product [Parascedosporium putredinis]|uniref:Major facilitator superfamily (MFS) profile domain-containing protein n=1 Tax=Parascedosporium putredinis TaxID=1442378 RepID=A0A9P1GXE8_9PEZI|nr:unnamed protein product [Parascedosporium putredinis]CAI7989731.1 unnamed protein product [Parascedosporium putredinis]
MVGLSERFSGTVLIVLITIVNATSMSWFGYDQGVFSGVLISKDFKKWFPETNEANISGITSSCFALGAFFGAIFAFTLGDKLGRRKTIAVGLTTNFIGAVLQIVSWHLPQMIVGRVINGFGFQLIFPIIVATALLCVPESPRWLMLKDRHEEARKVIARLHGKTQTSITKTMMLYGASTMGSCYLVAALCLRAAQNDKSKEATLGRVVTAMFFLYYFFYGTSFAKVAWVYNSEINSIGWRTRGAAAATATNWMGGFIVTQFTKAGVNNLKWGFYLIFAIICWAYFPVVYCFYPETTRRTLEDMDEIFIQNPSIFVCGKPDLTQRQRPQAFIEAEQQRIAAAGDEKTNVHHPRCQNCIEAEVECHYDDTPSQRIDTSGGSREILHKLQRIESLLDDQSRIVATLSSELHLRSTQEDIQGTSPNSQVSSVPAIGSRFSVPITTWPANIYEAQSDVSILPPLDIPVKHKTSSSYLLTLPSMKALIGEYPTDLFFLLESKNPLPSQLSFETIPHQPHLFTLIVRQLIT